jgi:putative aldouronate transport system substrate-binding protein
MLSSKKKIISLFLVLFLIAGFMAGCTGKVTTITTAPSGTTTTGATTTVATTTVPDKWQLPYDGEKIEIVINHEDFNNADKDILKGVIPETVLSGLGNVTLKFQFLTEMDTQIQLKMNANNMDDLAIWPGGSAQNIANSFGATGSLLDMTPYMQYMPIYAEWEQKLPQVFGTIEGKRYVLGSVYQVPLVTGFVQVNNYAKDELGLDLKAFKSTPANPGTYTVDDMLADLKAVKAANPDIWSPYMIWPGSGLTNWLQISFLGQTDAIPSESEVRVVCNWQGDKKWYYPLFEPAFKDMIAYCSTLFKEGLITPDYDTQSWDNVSKVLYGEKKSWFMWGGAHLFTDGAEDGLGAKVTITTNPTTQYQSKALVCAKPIGMSSGCVAVIGSNTKYPELCCAIMNYMNSPEVNDLLNWGVEGETYERCSPEEGDYDTSTSKKIINLDKYAYLVPDDKKISPLTLGYVIDPYRRLFSTFGAQIDQYKFTMGMAKPLFPRWVPIMLANFKYIKDYPETIIQNYSQPVFTLDETDIINKIMTDCNTVVARKLHDFISGKSDMSQWDAFVTEVKAAGDIQKVLDLYNSKPIVPFSK